jgi:hypothetical protein
MFKRFDKRLTSARISCDVSTINPMLPLLMSGDYQPRIEVQNLEKSGNKSGLVAMSASCSSVGMY